MKVANNEGAVRNVIDKYMVDGRSARSIGKEFGVSHGVILRILKNNSIQTRNYSEASGSRRLTIGCVKSYAKQFNYLCVSRKYKNAHSKLEWVCDKGHKFLATWANFKSGSRCPTCNSNRMKLSVEFVRSEFEKIGYILITQTYEGCEQKLKYICPNGHIHLITWHDWKSGCRCPFCNIGKSGNNLKLDIDFVRAIFIEKGYILLTEGYSNAYQKLDFICPNGHKGRISWAQFQQGHGCQICSLVNRSGVYHYNWKDGASFEPYASEFNNRLKRLILERDNYTCQNPNCWKTSKRLVPHHIDYNKKNCDPSNLITLCNSCNSRANFDREYHTAYYIDIMMGRNV